MAAGKESKAEQQIYERRMVVAVSPGSKKTHFLLRIRNQRGCSFPEKNSFSENFEIFERQVIGMARKKSDEKKREETRKNLEKMIKEKGLYGQVYLDKIDEYMSFYDNIKMLESRIITMESNENSKLKDLTDAISEKRRVSSEMRGILAFLDLKPEQSAGGGCPGPL